MKAIKISITAVSLLCLLLATCASKPRIQANATKPGTMVYFLRVVDRRSQAPVNQAKISVELNTAAKPHWSGVTDVGGFFQFTWDANHGSIQAHISVQAPGFASFDQNRSLIPDRLIELNREANDTDTH